MSILAKFEKQPADEQDFDIDYGEWLAGMGDTAPGPGGVTVYADTGITVLAYVLTDGVVKVWTSGGTDGTTYKITATVTTQGGRVKQAEIKVKVKEY
jgi:alkylation response protein AidB-like acyl-CoA dehydrogenase